VEKSTTSGHRSDDHRTIFCLRYDLDRGGAGKKLDDHGIITQPFAVAGGRQALSNESIDGYKLVAKQQRRPDPHKDAINPMPKATLPLRREPIDVTRHDPYLPGEHAFLKLDPSSAAQDGCT
jgi:hypothetical protein